MQYNIYGLSQKGIIKNDIDAKDIILIRFMMNFISSGKMKSLISEGKTFYWFFYQNIIDEIPAIKIKNKIALARRLKALTEKGLLEMYLKSDKEGTFTYYRFTDKMYHDLISSENDKTGKLNSIPPPKLKSIPGVNQKVNPKTSILIDSYTKKETISKEPFQGSKNDSFRKPNKYFLKVLKESFKLVDFKNRLPESANSCDVTKTYFKVEDFLIALQTGQLQENYVFDPGWITKNHIDFDDLKGKRKKNSTFRIIPAAVFTDLFLNAVKNYAEMRKEGYWPFDKKSLTLSISDFCYNYKTKKSWLLYCIFNKPVETQDIVTKKIIQKMDQEDFDFAEDFRQEMGWDENKFYKKLFFLKKWYDTVKDILIRHNLMGGIDFNSKVGTFTHLLDLIDTYQKTWRNKWTVNHFGYGNKTWIRFVEWVENEYKIELEPDCLINFIHGYETNFRKNL